MAASDHIVCTTVTLLCVQTSALGVVIVTEGHMHHVNNMGNLILALELLKVINLNLEDLCCESWK